VSRALKTLAIFAVIVVIFTLSRHAIHPSTTTTSTQSTTTTTIQVAKPVTNCKGSDFTGVFNQGQGAAGTIFASVTLTKSSGGSCTVMGQPLLTLQDKTGALIDAKILTTSPVDFPDATANAPAKKLTVVLGTSVTFSLGYSDVPVGSETCASATTLSVQFVAQGSTVTVTPAYPVEPCNANTVWVSPFY
jgi:hypothetical protein